MTYTCEQLEAMSGRELDAVVAEKVMGWQLVNCDTDEPATTPAHYRDAANNDGWAWIGRSGDEYAHAWCPSTSIADAFEVVKKMRADGWFYQIGDSMELSEDFARFTSPFFPPGGPVQDHIAHHKSPARAICISAALAVQATTSASPPSPSTPASRWGRRQD